MTKRVRDELTSPVSSADGPLVAHLIAPAPIGGAESVVSALAAGRRHPSLVILLARPGQDVPFASQLKESGVRVEVVREHPRRYLKQAAEVSRVLIDNSCDLIHTHVYHADMVGLIAARRAGVPAVATVHGYVGGAIRNRLYENLDRWFLRRFQSVICVSASLERLLVGSGIPGERVQVVHNGLASTRILSREDARRELGLPLDRPVVGWIGRLSYEKGPDLFLGAANKMRTPSSLACIVGDGPMKAELTPGSDGRTGAEVRFVGSVSGAARLLKAFDSIVLSSRSEGHPMTVLEAMAAGTPIVAFAVGGLPEVLSKETAWLVEPGDVDALARAIDESLDSRELARSKSRAATSFALDHYSLDAWVAAVEEVYHKVLEGEQ